MSGPDDAMRSTPVLVLEGSGRKRGHAYAEQAGDLVIDTVTRWRQQTAIGLTIDLDDYIHHLVTGTGLLATSQEFLPDVVEEIEGLSEAIGVAFTTLFAINLLDEEWWFRD